MVGKSIPFLFLGLVQLYAADATIGDRYRATAAQLIDTAMKDDAGLARLQYLCDRIGNRVSGSEALEKAIAWSAAEMKKAGLQNVQTPAVKVPHWVRGKESIVMLSPLQRTLPMLGLGNSIGTPAGGIEANVVVVSNFDELTALGAEKVKGKIVLYNAPFEGYGATVMYRSSGASRAAQLGAVASLVRSVTGHSLRTPHTGALRYDDGAPQIPAAAITVEDSQAIARLAKSGVPVRIRMAMEAKMEAPADSANVIGEITGSEKPEEVVVIGGHIDSWDIGQGAQDDGSGIMASLAAVALIRQLGLHPRRTIRVVFWTNEENGTAGGNAYRDWLGDKVKNHVAAIEMDGGAEKPIGFGAGAGEGRRRATPPGSAPVAGEHAGAVLSSAAFARMEEIGKLLESIDAGKIIKGGGGTDIGPIMAAGVPGLGLHTVGTHYFDWHHTEADTFDKINPQDFKQCVAAMAVMSFVLADMPERLSEMK
jgi:hypothetical protein